LALALALSPACGSDDHAVSHSAPVGINLKVKADEAAKSGTSQADKGINTESGNPYGKFVSDARAHLMRDPGRIEVQSVKLMLGAGSKGVTALEQALSGKVEVLFLMSDTNNTFAVAEVMDPKGPGPIGMRIVFDPVAPKGEDYTRLLNGSFKVVLRAPAPPTLTGKKDFEADLQVTFELAAFP
jgi:hypothetical protein